MNNINYNVANTGGRLYPVSVCLQMVLDYKKDYYPIYKLENISGHPFGWFYMNDKIAGYGEGIEISPGTELTNSIKVACKNLGYNYEHCLTNDWNEMINNIKKELANGNVLIYGPVAFNQLKYQIGAFRAPGVASHYIVIVGYDENNIYYHDPNGMSYISISFDKLKDISTKEVMIPGTKLYSCIIIKDKCENIGKLELYSRVLDSAVESYKEKKVRNNGYVGLVAIKKYAEDLDVCLGAKNINEKILILRKLGLYFYPKGNQIRSDAITFMKDISTDFSETKDIVEEFSEHFKDACAIYQRGAAMIIPHLVKLDEKELPTLLSTLKHDTLKLYEIEKRAYDCIVKIKNIIDIL